MNYLKFQTYVDGLSFCVSCHEFELDLILSICMVQDAGAADIRKAFRRLSLVLHPDKNSSPDADVQFRQVVNYLMFESHNHVLSSYDRCFAFCLQLVAVYDVIKDPVKRKYYDDILINGLPDWRSASYYYRRVRKMGLTELSIILFVIVTIGQYLVGWGSYLEKKLIVVCMQFGNHRL